MAVLVMIIQKKLMKVLVKGDHKKIQVLVHQLVLVALEVAKIQGLLLQE